MGNDRRKRYPETRQIVFKERGDSRGKLIVIEGEKDIPFEIARAFYIYESDRTAVRGCHAIRRSEFVLINVSGSSKVRVADGAQSQTYSLDKPSMGVYLPKMVWKEMYDFSENSVLLCLASEPYDAAEYIRDYDEYLREMQTYE